MKIIRNISIATTLVTALIAGSANATTISYYLDQSNDLPDGVNYAQVTISDGANGDIDFSVEVLSGAFSVSGDNFGMQTFSFNYNTTLPVTDDNISDIDPESWTISQDMNAGGGFGKFEFQLSGTGSTRTELLTFSISGVGGDTVYDYAIAADFLGNGTDQYFAAHIAGFDTTNGVDSAQFAGMTPVPVPAAAWLFGTGLLGLVGVARRRA